MLLAEGFTLFEGNNCLAYSGHADYYKNDKQSFIIPPKKTITVEVLLQVDYKKMSSAAKRIRYTFTLMRLGDSTPPRYGHFELTAAITSSPH